MNKKPPLARALLPLERQLINGDKSAVESLFMQHGDAALRHLSGSFGKRLTREERVDCVQDALLQVLLRLREYDPALSSPETYFKMRAKSAARKYIRERDQLLVALAEDAALLATDPSLDQSPEHSAERKEREARLYAAISRLPHNYRLAAVAWLRWGPDAYAQRVAEEVGRPAELIPTWLYRAKQALRHELGIKEEWIE